MSGIVKSYNPPYTDSKQVYGYISQNISKWANEAVLIREKYYVVFLIRIGHTKIYSGINCNLNLAPSISSEYVTMSIFLKEALISL